MDKISPENYQVEDFISDESFINYHFQSNRNDRLYWEEWLINNPGKQVLVKEAIEMLETLSLTLSEKEYRQELKRITAVINRKKKHRVSKLPGSNKLILWYKKKKNDAISFASITDSCCRWILVSPVATELYLFPPK